MNLLASTSLLAQAEESQVLGPGPVAGLIFLLLAVATFLLWRNMAKRLGDVRRRAEEDAARGGDAPGEDRPGGRPGRQG